MKRKIFRGILIFGWLLLVQYALGERMTHHIWYSLLGTLLSMFGTMLIYFLFKRKKVE